MNGSMVVIVFAGPGTGGQREADVDGEMAMADAHDSSDLEVHGYSRVGHKVTMVITLLGVLLSLLLSTHEPSSSGFEPLVQKKLVSRLPRFFYQQSSALS